MAEIKVTNQARVVQGHVLDVAKDPLVAALRRYDPLLYVKWNPKKNKGLGTWELRRKPEFKSVKAGRLVESPRGPVRIPGNIYEYEGVTIIKLEYNENSFENHVKDFDYLTYGMVDWLASHDLWKYGYKGKNVNRDAEYNEAVYLNKIDDEAAAERDYMIKQHKTQFRDFAEYIRAGGDPTRIIEYWGKQS